MARTNGDTAPNLKEVSPTDRRWLIISPECRRRVEILPRNIGYVEEAAARQLGADDIRKLITSAPVSVTQLEAMQRQQVTDARAAAGALIDPNAFQSQMANRNMAQQPVTEKILLADENDPEAAKLGYAAYDNIPAPADPPRPVPSEYTSPERYFAEDHGIAPPQVQQAEMVVARQAQTAALAAAARPAITTEYGMGITAQDQQDAWARNVEAWEAEMRQQNQPQQPVTGSLDQASALDRKAGATQAVMQYDNAEQQRLYEDAVLKVLEARGSTGM